MIKRVLKPLRAATLTRNSLNQKSFSKSAFNSAQVPKAIGPYSHSVIWSPQPMDKVIYSSGMLGLAPETGKLVSEEVGEQLDQALKNLSTLLGEAGTSLTNVMKVTIFLTNMSDYARINEVYCQHFTSEEDAPARSVVAVKELPAGAKVEIELVSIVQK
mmetsp:Transcript_11974/g.13126  ORF Transcript_11974/g.13126 Transcript_11974/m.13126 type:complete len:159 (+) Transcript_11974:55-531(+)